MRDLLKKLVDDPRPVAYCRLVATRGSTPQKPGAAMLVYANGSQFGTLGGGCVEAEVKRRAIGILAGGGPEVVSFQLDHDYGWDDGLICGGRMEVLVWPIAEDVADPGRVYLSELHTAFESGCGGTEVVTFATMEGSTTPDVDARPCCFLFGPDGGLIAALPSWDGDESIVAEIATGVASLHSHDRPKMEEGIVYLPIEVRHHLVIVGGGHVGQAVAQLAHQIGFNVTIVDDRQEFINADRFPMTRADERLCGQLATVLPEIAVNAQTYCLIVTRGHNHDQEALFHLVNRGAKYVGMIGSRRKVRLIFENLLAEGVSQAALDAVHAPVGVKIGSQTVSEIAVSIAAQLIAVRRDAV